MFDAAVEVGVRALLSVDDTDDDSAVRHRLESEGVAPWLAQRLVVFLPLAIGRLLLQEAEFSDTYLDGHVERPLAADPVYVAIQQRVAEKVSAEESERIGLRSAEVAAVNKALHAGSKIGDLVLGRAVLAEPLAPLGDGDGGVPSPRAVFASLVAAHGFSVNGDGTVGDLRLDARVVPHPSPTGVMAQTDFIVSHPALARGWLIESFAGMGATWSDAIGQSIAKFEQGSLHPIIAALLDRSRTQDQVAWFPFDHPNGRFEVCFGAMQTLFSNQPSSHPALWPVVDSLQSVPLSPQVHGLRMLLSYKNGMLSTNEVLLDNEPCPAGQGAAAATPFDLTAGFVTTRLFGLITPAA